jgi:protein gp37
MADHTGIGWTDATWNPVVGCSLVSPGCTNCYAMGQAARIVRCSEGLGRASAYDGTVEAVKGKPVWTGKVALASDATLTQPLRWKKPRRIFVNSMGDLFHEDVPDEWIDRVFAVMALAPQHTFHILTKRSARMRAYLTQTRTVEKADVRNRLAWDTTIEVMNLWAPQWKSETPYGTHRSRAIQAFTAWPLPNVWLGVSAEDQRRADQRIPDLLATPAAIRFVSAEPLLGPIDFGRMQDGLPDNAWLTWLDTLDWIIVGGESGPNARPMHPDWARSIRDQCAAAGTAFFFKQWGEWAPSTPEQASGNPRSGWRCLAGHPHVAKREELYPEAGAAFIEHMGKKAAGRLLDGVTHDAMPEVRHG